VDLLLLIIVLENKFTNLETYWPNHSTNIKKCFNWDIICRLKCLLNCMEIRASPMRMTKQYMVNMTIYHWPYSDRWRFWEKCKWWTCQQMKLSGVLGRALFFCKLKSTMLHTSRHCMVLHVLYNCCFYQHIWTYSLLQILKWQTSNEKSGNNNLSN